MVVVLNKLQGMFMDISLFFMLFSLILMVAQRSPVYAVFSLFLTALSTFSFLLLISAEFFAFLTVLIYTGVITVLFLVVVIMCNLRKISVGNIWTQVIFDPTNIIVALKCGWVSRIYCNSLHPLLVQTVSLNATNLYTLDVVQFIALFNEHSVAFLFCGLLIFIVMVGSLLVLSLVIQHIFIGLSALTFFTTGILSWAQGYSFYAVYAWTFSVASIVVFGRKFCKLSTFNNVQNGSECFSFTTHFDDFHQSGLFDNCLGYWNFIKHFDDFNHPDLFNLVGWDVCMPIVSLLFLTMVPYKTKVAFETREWKGCIGQVSALLWRCGIFGEFICAVNFGFIGSDAAFRLDVSSSSGGGNTQHRQDNNSSYRSLFNTGSGSSSGGSDDDDKSRNFIKIVVVAVAAYALYKLYTNYMSGEASNDLNSLVPAAVYDAFVAWTGTGTHVAFCEYLKQQGRIGESVSFTDLDKALHKGVALYATESERSRAIKQMSKFCCNIDMTAQPRKSAWHSYLENIAKKSQ